MKPRSATVLLVILILSTFALAQAKRTTRRLAPTIPDGTVISVRMIDPVDSATSQVGDQFRGTLQNPIVVDGNTVYPKGADVMGRVDAVHKSGRLSDPGVLTLSLQYVAYGSSRTNLNVQPYTIKGESHTKSNVEKIGGGAAIGAVIGAIAGGGKGAAIGAGVGAAGGTGVAAATGKKEAKVESEAILEWTTVGTSSQATTGQPASSDQGSSRDRSYNDQGYNDSGNQGRDQNYSDDSGNYDQYMFSGHDRRVINQCFSDNYDNLPPGLAKRGDLPPGLERQLQRNGTLPPGLQKRVSPMPDVCERQLPRLPDVLRRVVYAGHVMLLNDANNIIDMFLLDNAD